MNTCTVTDAFLGIPGDECGQPAVATLTTTCPNGCPAETSPVCDGHADAFTPPSPGEETPGLLCPACAEAGRRRAYVAVEVTR